MATCARALANAQAGAREHEGALAWRSITWILHIDAADLVALYQAAGAVVQLSFTRHSYLCANFRRSQPRCLLGAGRRSQFQTDRVVVPRLTAELNCQLPCFLFC
jgi:hypothetical protein